ncbi:MAG: L,D-transpeptidase family protein [Firmicutes bacterium]|nr:L,D-transpeptidase family protein [Bacillota bacterium]MCL5039168.1 L,D-transpeptidase family protein [Bacillota bacterium]
MVSRQASITWLLLFCVIASNFVGLNSGIGAAAETGANSPFREGLGESAKKDQVSSEPAAQPVAAPAGEKVTKGSTLLWPVPPPEGILINIPGFYLALWHGGREVKRYPIGVGRSAAETPVGDFAVAVKVVEPTWYPLEKDQPPVPPGPENPLGSRWLGLTVSRYGMHGTNVPDSIGHSVSRGCIRLHNRDVEELFELVQVGTLVRIAYEPVALEREPVSGRTWLRLYPDIYRRVKDGKALLQEIFAASGYPATLSEEELDELWQRPRPSSFPLEVEVWLNGRPIRPYGYVENGRILVPLRPLAEATGERVNWDEIRKVASTAGREFYGALRNSRLFVDSEEFTKTFQARSYWEPSQRHLALTVLTVRGEGGALTRQAFLQQGHAMVPLPFLNQILGFPGKARSDGKVTFGEKEFPSLLRDGEVYVPLRAVAEGLGARVDWDPETWTARVSPPARTRP